MDESTQRRIAGLSSKDKVRLKMLLRGRRLVGSSLVAKALVDCGIERLSGVGGLPAYGIYGECAKLGMRILGTRRQFSSTIMAGVDNYISGKLIHAVCATPGPGLTEALTGVLVARDNNVPLLIVGCKRALRTEGSGDFQDLDPIPLMKPITKWAVTVKNASELMPTIHKACQIALNGVPGPVFVGIPEDVLGDYSIPINIEEPKRERSETIKEDCLEEVSRLLLEGKRPLLCLGEDLRWGYSRTVLEELVTGFQLPFITTPMGRGLLPEDHPHCVNTARRKVIHRADVFLLAGAWFDWRLRKGSELSEGCKVIHVHPNPDLLGRNVQPVESCCARPMAFLGELATHIPELSPDRRIWMEEISRLRARKPDPLPLSWMCGPEYVPPAILYKAIRNRLQPDHIIVVEGNIHLSLALHYLDSYSPFSRFDPGQNGCIGSGIPQAMGACLAQPNRPVLALVGDTGFGMTGMELETAVRHGLDFKLIIANNSGISGKLAQVTALGDHYPERVFQFQENIPYHKVARALGVPGWNMDTPDNLEEVLDAVFSVKGPACINVRLDPATPDPAIW